MISSLCHCGMLSILAPELLTEQIIFGSKYPFFTAYSWSSVPWNGTKTEQLVLSELNCRLSSIVSNASSLVSSGNPIILLILKVMPSFSTIFIFLIASSFVYSRLTTSARNFSLPCSRPKVTLSKPTSFILLNFSSSTVSIRVWHQNGSLILEYILINWSNSWSLQAKNVSAQK